MFPPRPPYRHRRQQYTVTNFKLSSIPLGSRGLFFEAGCQPVHCTSALLYCAVKLLIHFGCQTFPESVKRKVKKN